LSSLPLKDQEEDLPMTVIAQVTLVQTTVMLVLSLQGTAGNKGQSTRVAQIVYWMGYWKMCLQGQEVEGLLLDILLLLTLGLHHLEDVGIWRGVIVSP
jgi:hypothetical protein